MCQGAGAPITYSLSQSTKALITLSSTLARTCSRQKIGGFDWTQPEPMDHTTTSPKRKTHVAPKQQKGQQEKQA
eukprot:1144536-Pelagomonas_calceolata.AAC.2